MFPPLNTSNESLPPSTEFDREIRRQDAGELHLWFIAIATILVVGTGLVLVAGTGVMWGSGSSEHETQNLPQLLVGFMALIIILALYLLIQRQSLLAARSALLEQFTRADKATAASFIDPLTGLFNRRYMQDCVVREARRVDRSGGTFALLMLDADKFSEVNNRFGHATGDRLLRELSGLLTRVFRSSDIIVRYGGDEFLVLMPDTDQAQSQLAVGRLMAELARRNASSTTGAYSIDLSYGVACYTQGDEVEKVLELADQRMYGQKRYSTEPAHRSEVRQNSEFPEGSSSDNELVLPVDRDLQQSEVKSR